jgi:predicted transcriptional regulator
MPRSRSKTSKSASVREALRLHPEKSASEIAKELGVTPGLVYNIKAAEHKKNGIVHGKKRRRKMGARHRAKVGAPKGAHEALDSAFEFVTKVGGLLHAEQLIGKLKTLKERL